LSKQYEKLFFGELHTNSANFSQKNWRISAHKFGIMMLMKLNGKFFPELCLPVSFCWAIKRFVKSTTGGS